MAIEVVQIDKGGKGNNGSAARWVVKRDGNEIGFIDKYPNTKTDQHPYKAYAGSLGGMNLVDNFFESGAKGLKMAVAAVVAKGCVS